MNMKKTLFRDLPYEGAVDVKITMLDRKNSRMKLQSRYGVHLTAIPYNRAGWTRLAVGDHLTVELVRYEGSLDKNNNPIIHGKLEVL
jgi:hypothetical protein